jgi:Carboxypeptidase regulatory-like domain
MKLLGTTLLLTWTLLASGLADASEGTVLAIRPEGVVIDASALPGLQPGSRVGFLRSDGQRTPAGQGFVLDAQGGQALIGVTPGTGVRVNDLVVLCPTRTGGNDAVRPLVESLRTQVSSPQVQQTAGRLLATLDARDAAIQQGNCDVARFDSEIEGLLAQLQNEAAAAQAAAPSAAPGYSSAGGAATNPPPAGGYAPGGYAPAGPTSPPAAGGMAYPPSGTPDTPPSGYIAGGAPAGPASPPGDAIDTASRGVDLLAKLAVIAQSLGVNPGGAPSASGGYPSAGGGYGTPGGGSYGSPPSGGTTSPASGGYPSAGGGYGTPGGGSYGSPPSGGTTPPPGGGYPPPTGGYVTSGAGSYGSTPGGGTTPPASGGYPPPAGSTSGGTGAAKSAGVRPAWQVNQLPSGTIRPYVAAIPKATVAGRVQTQTGQPLAAAQITIGDAKGQTDGKGQSDVKGQSDAQGQFTIPGLAPGQYIVTVTATGYQKQTRTVTLDAGETERLVVVMPRGAVITPFRAVPKTP